MAQCGALGYGALEAAVTGVAGENMATHLVTATALPSRGLLTAKGA